MTNTVTVQTGRRLDAAGFPQPSPAPGQWWGDESGVVLIFGETIPQPGKYWEDENKVMQPVVGLSPVVHYVADGRPIIDDYFDARDFTGLVYLPTVGDILKELGERYSINLVDEKYWTIHREKHTNFQGSEYDYITESYPINDHKHPAEAAALAWISLRGNPADLDEF